LLKKLSHVLVKVIAILGVIKPCTCSYMPVNCVVWYTAVAHICGKFGFRA